MLRGDIQERVRQIFEEIAINHGFAIDTMEVAQDHVHIFLSFPPRYSISKVVGMLKSISASVIFREYPEVKKRIRLMHPYWNLFSVGIGCGCR